MKYIAVIEMDLEDWDEALEKFKQFQAKSEKAPEMFPKRIAGYSVIGNPYTSFQVYETDDPKQLANLAFHYRDVLKIKYFPIMDTFQMIEHLQKIK